MKKQPAPWKPGKRLDYHPGLINSEICNLANQVKQFSRGKFLVTRPTLVHYANVLNIDVAGKTDQQLIKEIANRAPCQWIARMYEWAKMPQNAAHTAALNRYVTDEMANIILKVKNNQNLTTSTSFALPNPLNPQEEQLIQEVNQAIMNAPKPDKQFMVYRGVYGEANNVPQPGQIIRLDTPQSGTFKIDMAIEKYTNSNSDPICCLQEVLIPRNATVAYHPAEDQVIFPRFGRFYVVSPPMLKSYMIDEKTYKVLTYQVVYIDNLGSPFDDVNNDSSLNAELLMEAYQENLSFPYTMLYELVAVSSYSLESNQGSGRDKKTGMLQVSLEQLYGMVTMLGLLPIQDRTLLKYWDNNVAKPLIQIQPIIKSDPQYQIVLRNDQTKFFSSPKFMQGFAAVARWYDLDPYDYFKEIKETSTDKKIYVRL